VGGCGRVRFAIWLAVGSAQLPAAVTAQQPPKSSCNFNLYEGTLAEVTTPSAGLERGDIVVIYRTEGDWTCGYLTGKTGGGPGWILTNAIRAAASDPNPPLSAWVGTWRDGEGAITIGTAATGGALTVKGEAVWHGAADLAHSGAFSGEATPKGNQLHYATGTSRYDCVVDAVLYEKYLLVNDNGQCGGLNVRFSGIWKRAPSPVSFGQPHPS
jgi:hypothetical protein